MVTLVETPVFWYAAAVVTSAMVVRAMTGFGAALVLAPLLSLVLDLRQVVPVAAFVQVATGLPLTVSAWRQVAPRALALLLVGSLVGLPVGAVLLTALPLHWLERGLGLFTLLFGLHRLLASQERQFVAPGRLMRWLGAPVGTLSGLLAGSIGTGGPPVVAYLYYRLPEPNGRRATLLAYFLIVDSLRLAGYARLGVGDRSVIWLALALVPFSLLGSLIGARILRQARRETIGNGVALLLVVTGVLLLF